MDRVLTIGAIRRRYMPTMGEPKVSEELLPLAADGAVVMWVECVALTARARRAWPITFVARQRIDATPAALRHLAGLAEMRWQIKSTIHGWDLTMVMVMGEGEQPDAIAEDRYGCLAIEYDTGAYSADQVCKKSRAYQQIFGRQLWGVPYKARQHWLRNHLPSQTTVLFSPWW